MDFNFILFAIKIKNEVKKMNELRKALNEGRKVSGTLISLTDPCVCEIMGNVGFDNVWIDFEHTYLSYENVLCHLNAAKSVGISSVVRVPQNDLTATKKVLEMGPDGIIFPMITSAKEARDAISMTLYPPLGVRGVGPMRAVDYDTAKYGEYVFEKNFELCRFVQIEHIGLIDQLEEAAEIPFLDGFVFGPCDLSCSMGDNLNVLGDKVFSRIEKAASFLKSKGKKIGLAGSPSPSDIEKWASLDLDILWAGWDWSLLYTEAKKALQNIKDFYK